jgi:CBS domain-containing protein
MRTIEGLRRSGVGIEANRTIHDAESMMEQTGVGVLAVLDGGRLVDIVTDRDLVRRGLARSLLADAVPMAS